MANGTSRLAQARMILKGQGGQMEHIEELAIENGSRKGKLPKIPLKNPSEHNHS